MTGVGALSRRVDRVARGDVKPRMRTLAECEELLAALDEVERLSSLPKLTRKQVKERDRLRALLDEDDARMRRDAQYDPSLADLLAELDSLTPEQVAQRIDVIRQEKAKLVRV